MSGERHALLAAAADAALALSATRPWGDVALAEIAGDAGTDLAAFARHGVTREAILRAMDARFDQAAAAGVTAVDRRESAKDRLFDAIMTRMEAMEPHKAGVLSIRAAEAADPALRLALAARRVRAARWLLEAAGLGASGLGGLARVAAVANILRATEAAWAADGPDFTRTMANLDGALRDAALWAERLARFSRRRPEFAASPEAPPATSDQA